MDNSKHKERDNYAIIGGVIIIVVIALLVFMGTRTNKELKEYCDGQVDYHPAGSPIFGRPSENEYYTYGSAFWGKNFKTKEEAIDYCMKANEDLFDY